MRRVVICAAVSSKDKQQDPETQVRALQSVADRKGYTVVETLRFKQSRWDADSEKEVQAAALLPILEGRADLLLVWAWDRIGRGKADAAFRFINNLEKRLGAGFESMQEPFLSTGADPAVRELLLPIIAWVANRESSQKSERLKAKAEFKKQMATNGGGRASWGRGKMPSDDDRRFIHDRRAAGDVLRAIAKATGLSLGTVHRMLEQERPAGEVPASYVPRQADEQAKAATDGTTPAEGVGLEQAVAGAVRLTHSSNAAGPAEGAQENRADTSAVQQATSAQVQTVQDDSTRKGAT